MLEVNNINHRGCFIKNVIKFTAVDLKSLFSTGIRILLGSQDPLRSPSYVEVFGRVITVTLNRSRWYDIPFSREESLQSDKKIIVVFGSSQDPENVTMIDSIKVYVFSNVIEHFTLLKYFSYGKSKESFGWPEENDDNVVSTGLTQTPTVAFLNNETDYLQSGLPINGTMER